jgi:hypothetical protein
MSLIVSKASAYRTLIRAGLARDFTEARERFAALLEDDRLACNMTTTAAIDRIIATKETP